MNVKTAPGYTDNHDRHVTRLAKKCAENINTAASSTSARDSCRYDAYDFPADASRFSCMMESKNNSGSRVMHVTDTVNVGDDDEIKNMHLAHSVRNL